jgi:hypothetical protein
MARDVPAPGGNRDTDGVMGRRGATLLLAAMHAADLVVSVVDPRLLWSGAQPRSRHRPAGARRPWPRPPGCRTQASPHRHGGIRVPAPAPTQSVAGVAGYGKPSQLASATNGPSARPVLTWAMCEGNTWMKSNAP